MTSIFCGWGGGGWTCERRAASDGMLQCNATCAIINKAGCISGGRQNTLGVDVYVRGPMGLSRLSIAELYGEIMSQSELNLAMQPGEGVLLEAFLRCTRNFLEFGSGGSTCLASTMVQNSITSVDSSQEWLDLVEAQCLPHPVRPKLLLADIGPIREWGYPIDDQARDRWPNYFNGVWEKIDSASIDFCLVDGRFRVACFLTAILRCSPAVFVAIHDYKSRPHYHAIEKFAEKLAEYSDLAVFRRRRSVSDILLRTEINNWKFSPD